MAKNQNTKQIEVKLINPNKKQVDYWTKRAERDYIAGEKDSLQIVKELRKIYNTTIRNIEEKINAFYGKYDINENLIYEEINKLLSKSELKSFKDYLAQCIEYQKKYNIPTNQYKLLKLKANITRWEELKTQIQFELDKLTNTSDEKIGELLYNTYEAGYYKTIFNNQQFTGNSTPFNGLNKTAIEKAIRTKYLGENYSSRIWQNQVRLMSTLTQEIPRGIVLGYNPRKLAREIISKRVDKQAYNNTLRLIRTEYNKILNDATLQGYKACGIERYKIMSALEQKDRTCEDCQSLDYRESKIAPKITEAIIGVNFPPFHPNCRCTTIPYFEEIEVVIENKNLDRNKVGFSTYEEWMSGLVHLEGNKLIYNKNYRKEG